MRPSSGVQEGHCLAATAADILIETIQDWGVDVVFGLHFATSLIRGEPNREKMALTVLGDRVRELL